MILAMPPKHSDLPVSMSEIARVGGLVRAYYNTEDCLRQ
jgi:hypothetical protein